MPSPIILNLYDPETQEKKDTKVCNFIPWKMLKQAIRLNKSIGKKPVDQWEDEDIDALTYLIINIFRNGLTVEILDEQSDLGEMATVMRSIVSRAHSSMDPTSPPKA